MFEAERGLVQAQAELQRQDQVSISRSSSATLSVDPVTLVATVAPLTAVWAGEAHCKPPSASGDVTLGPGQIAQRSMSISIPPDAPLIAVNDVVTIVAAADPTVVAGGSWRVVGVDGSGFWAAFISLQCVEQYPSTQWTGSE